MDASKLIDEFIENLNDWQSITFNDIRKSILSASPDIVEHWKYRGAPVWSCNGAICVANAYKEKIKLTFNDGADLPDPNEIFNNGLEGKKWRSIDLYEGDCIDGDALKEIVQSAIKFNISKKKSKK